MATKARTMTPLKKKSKEVYLTQDAINGLKAELEDLLHNQRDRIISRIATAASFGDLSENSEYEQAKNEQGMIEGRILEIQDILANAVVIKKARSNAVYIGSTVKVTVSNKEEPISFTVVDAPEVDLSKNKISHKSPVGSGLMDKEVGQSFQIETPKGILTYKVLEIS
jgi:transcription elongation factor GreA